jgi:hypothetical protein
MQPISVTVGGLPAADTDAIAASQTPVAAGDLTLTATPYSLNPPRRVTITAVADESARTFTVYGTTYGGGSISEVIAGPNATTATSTLDFATVTQIAVDDATADAVEAGFAQSGGSRWVRMDSWANAGSVVQVSVSGTVTYSVQTTMDDPNDPVSPVAVGDVSWLDTLDGNLVSESADKSGFIAYTPTWVRIVGSGGTGTATMRIAQFGNATY